MDRRTSYNLKVHAVLVVLVIIVRSNAAPLILALVTLLIILIPLFAHTALCVCIFVCIGVWVSCRWSVQSADQ
jgi:hypothetical protein